ncbi:uncharacterized protein HMPREF1541_02262 [Cyphellophora europaea CBS 101466]|uniref:Uncharacterized protein n=1 Tax=Cyphellophora europaea (strain CBS 101466) TaxID=1220924 RepID=W2S576_CYPE1|nr:uncharacterized protein HMPREF1541_02262 [Cyphellophora europaea CBS 101466]ETN43104.1 hypothetical protein HMPREF1541_02262 [Cyphellophora europaea CBS 101466]
MIIPYAVTSLVLALLAVAQPLSTTTPPPPDCDHLIRPSLSATFDWSSPAALSLAQCLQSLRLPHPNPSTCLFYTAHSKVDAIRYALEFDRTTVYDVFQPQYFNRSAQPAKTWDALGHMRDLFKVTSKAYAMSCSGTANLVLPDGVKDDDVCRESIWVTDEYEVIRAGDSGVVLPIWRVTWRRDAGGVWKWFVDILKAAKVEAVGKTFKKRSDVIANNAESHWWDAGAQRTLMPPNEVKASVNDKLEQLRQQWGWNGLEEGHTEDLWAIKSGMCGR